MMGKIKNKQRLHAKAAKCVKNAAKQEHSEDVEMDLPSVSRAGSVAGGTMFSGMDIDIEKLEGQLPDLDDARSVVTSKSFRGLNISKKDKRKVKHDFFMKKIDGIQTAAAELKKKKKREKTVITGDLMGLQDTLPTLELLMKTTKHSHTHNVPKERSTNKTKKRQKDMLSDINLFKQVLNHPAYQSNPTSAISEHLQNKLKQI